MFTVAAAGALIAPASGRSELPRFLVRLENQRLLNNFFLFISRSSVLFASLLRPPLPPASLLLEPLLPSGHYEAIPIIRVMLQSFPRFPGTLPRSRVSRPAATRTIQGLSDVFVGNEVL